MSDRPVREHTKGARWCFEHDSHQGWRWLRLDERDELIEYGEFFDTYGECVMAAIRHALTLRCDPPGPATSRPDRELPS